MGLGRCVVWGWEDAWCRVGSVRGLGLGGCMVKVRGVGFRRCVVWGW